MTDPVFRNRGAWGSGLARRLTSLEVDGNFWSLLVRIVDLEAAPISPASIDHFEVVGVTFYVHMSDESVLGPYTLPYATFRSRGAWTTLTGYSVLDTVTVNGGLYLVLLSHTSAASFDAGANDGLGHDYYSLMIQTPGSAIPTGGAVGQVATKSTTSDFAMTWSWKLPSGMSTRKWLMSNSSTQDDASWQRPDASDVTYVPSTGSGLTASNVEDGLEQLAVIANAAVAAAGGTAADIEYTPSTASGLTDANVKDALDELGARDTRGKQTLWIPASAMTPLLTNGADQGLIETSTYKNVLKTLDFDPSTIEHAQFEIAMPKSWDGNDLSFQIYWSRATGATAYDVLWRLEALSVLSNFSTLDDAMVRSADILDSSNALLVDKLYVTNLTTLTSPGGSAGTMIMFRLSRVASDGTDTLDIDARLQGMQIFYTADKFSDS